jgi:hypothetical protein
MSDVTTVNHTNHTDGDDTTVAVSMTMDNWTPIVAIILCCVIAACLLVTCFTDKSGSTQSACQYSALALAGVLLVVLLVACYRKWSRRNDDDDRCGDCENFEDFEWGNNGFEHKTWKADRRTHKIVGPAADSSELRTWQYNPQNSLVDYRFFKTQDGAHTDRLAPIARPRVGVYSGLPNVDVSDELGATSTRFPDLHSCTQKYVQQHTASPIPFQDAPVPYAY